MLLPMGERETEREKEKRWKRERRKRALGLVLVKLVLDGWLSLSTIDDCEDPRTTDPYTCI